MVQFGTLCGGTMKLVINYDFMEAVCNAREPFNTFKVVRNNKKKWMVVDLPLFVAFTFIAPDRIVGNAILISSYIVLDVASHMMAHSIVKEDAYYEEASYQLRNLVSQFGNLNISTDYELLLQSELYKKDRKLELKKNPHILESKYIMVPTYNFNGDVKDTSILQEHVVGSREYVLSLGTPKKALQPAYSSI